MKTIKKIFVSVFLLLSVNSIMAQYGNNGSGRNGYGQNNQMGQMSQMNQSTQPDSPKPIPVEVTVGKIMEKLKVDITLDALQEIAIANVLKESLKAQGVILKQETSQDDKMKDIKALSEITDMKVMNFLDKDQKIKYLALIEENKNPKKSKRK